MCRDMVTDFLFSIRHEGKISMKNTFLHQGFPQGQSVEMLDV